MAVDLGGDTAAAVAAALLADTWGIVSAHPGLRPVLATPEPEVDHGLGPVEAWDQGGGDLGARIERTLRRALAHASGAFAVGADAPGIGSDRYTVALRALEDHDAVIGASRDGGFYLLGLRSCPTGLLVDLPWSDPRTGAATRDRLIERGLTVADLPVGSDIDRLDDLRGLRRTVPREQAPHTHAVLDTLGWPR